jgi:hypothetical protein
LWISQFGNIFFYENIYLNHGYELLRAHKYGGISGYDQSSFERYNRIVKRLRLCFTFAGQSKFFYLIPKITDPPPPELFPGIASLCGIPADQDVLFQNAMQVPFSVEFIKTLDTEIMKLVQRKKQRKDLEQDVQAQIPDSSLPDCALLLSDDEVAMLDDLVDASDELNQLIADSVSANPLEFIPNLVDEDDPEILVGAQLTTQFQKEGAFKTNQDLADGDKEAPLQQHDYVALGKILERPYLRLLVHQLCPSLVNPAKKEKHRLQVDHIPIHTVKM